jgi:hypothetical protein
MDTEWTLTLTLNEFYFETKIAKEVFSRLINNFELNFRIIENTTPIFKVTCKGRDLNRLDSFKLTFKYDCNMIPQMVNNKDSRIYTYERLF